MSLPPPDTTSTKPDKPKPKRILKKKGGNPKVGSRGGYHSAIGTTDKKAVARALYEGNPGATCLTVATEMGCTWPTVKRWKAESGQAGNPWKPCARTVPDLAGRAAALANSFNTKMSELGKPLSDDVAVAEASRELSLDHAVSVRAGVLDRHRKEWAAPRRLAYTALQKGHAGQVSEAFEVAKLAKITSETLQIIQAGECRAFGMNHDARGADGGTVVVIERESSATAPNASQTRPPPELESLGESVPTDIAGLGADEDF
jgi:hypothetical protein